MKTYMIDCSKFCGYVKINDEDIIVESMPIIRKFIGQPLKNLVNWTNKNFKYCKLVILNEETLWD